MTGWVSTAETVIDHTGRAPESVVEALNSLGDRSPGDGKKRAAVRDFVVSVSLELAEARAQVVADRAELDRLRKQVAREESQRLELERLRSLGGPAPATNAPNWINRTSQGGVL